MNAINHPTSGRNRYCGPAALSIIAGIDSGAAARLIRSISGQRAVKGTAYSSMLEALERLNFRWYSVHTPACTFAYWAENLRDPAKTYLICAGNHYRVVSGRMVCCSLTQKPVFIGQASRRRARMAKVWVVEPAGEIRLDLIPQAPGRPSKSPLRRKVKALMADLHASYDRDDIPDAYYLTTELVYCTNGEDPWYGDHYCFSLEEVHDRLVELKEMLETGRVHLPVADQNAVAASPSANEGGAS